MSEVFLSYSTKKDGKLAALVRRQLEYLGLKVFQDVTDLSAGTHIAEDVDKYLASAKAVFVLWTKNSMNSPWVLSEAQKALARGVLVTAAFGIAPTDLQTPFNTILAPDLADWIGSENKVAHPGWKRVLARLGKLTRRPLVTLADVLESGTAQAKRRFIAKYPEDEFARKLKDELCTVAILDQKLSTLRELVVEQLAEGVVPHSAVRTLEPVTLLNLLNDAPLKEESSIKSKHHVSELADSRPLRNVRALHRTHLNAIQGFVPIYRTPRPNTDWLTYFTKAFEHPQPYFDTKLLYMAPGGARFWCDMSAGEKQTQAYAELQTAFSEKFREVIDGLYLQTTRVNIIDLGPGDFSKGAKILDHFLNQKHIKEINYLPVDVSYDMLNSGLLSLETTNVLWRVLERGRIAGVHSSFSDLKDYNALWGTRCTNIFLLLGNTLGNQSNESMTLSDIGGAMKPGDILITELQLFEPQPKSIEKLTESVQKGKPFYTGPFSAVGCSQDDIELFVRPPSSKIANSARAVEYQLVCELKRPLVVRTPLLKHEVNVPKTGVLVYIVRKYREAEILKLFVEAGFDKDAATSAKWEKGGREYYYLAIRKQNS